MRNYTVKSLSACIVLAAALIGCRQTAGTSSESEYACDSLPFDMEAIELTSFPSLSKDVTEYGAVGDGTTLNTEAINKAIQDVSESGGGTVVIPAGIWLSGPVVMSDNVNLHLEQNAVLLFSGDHSLYPIIETSFEGLNTHRCQSPLSAREASNIAITGKGVIDGNGDTWRPVKKNKQTPSQWDKLVASGGVVDNNVWYPSAGSLKGAVASRTNFNVATGINTDEEWEEIRDWLRPALLSFVKCDRVLIEGVTFKNSPGWCLHPLSCSNVIIDGVSVSNPWYSQNGDALDLESCNAVLIQNSVFDAGDDCICLKSGKDKTGRDRGEPCRNVVIRNNVALHGHGGFVVGSEMSGGVKNIYVSNCTFLGTDVGLRFKSTRGRGGVVDSIYISDINMVGIANDAVVFDLYYGGKAPGEEDNAGAGTAEIPPVTEETPAFRDISIKDVVAVGAGRAAFFNGLPEMPVRNVLLENVTVSGAGEGIVIKHAEGITLTDVKVVTKRGGDNLSLQEVKDVNVNGKAYDAVDAAQSIRF